MARTVTISLMLTSLLAATALADDSPSARPNQTDRQLMKQCMAEQKSKGGQSDADMKKACQEQVKSYRNHPSATSPETAPHP